MAAADARFHDLVFEIGANPVLAGMYRPMRDMMVESQRLPMTLKMRLGDTLGGTSHALRATRGAGRRGRRGRDAEPYPGGGAALRHCDRLRLVALERRDGVDLERRRLQRSRRKSQPYQFGPYDEDNWRGTR